ncbi:MAG: hypothetical protein NTU73_07520 [Ignavibacteriae bacterium]|nr:hypothetical protein [Ignavibacteriota bacterium]
MMNIRISPSSVKSALFLIIQFLCIFILGYTGKLLPENFILISLLILSLLLALWSMIIMKFHFNGAPEVLPGMTLKTSGPYKLIRHPMYTSLLGLGAVWIINDFSVFRFAIFIILLIDLLFKMYYEEKFLLEKFSEYAEYKIHTKRIIPFIF